MRMLRTFEDLAVPDQIARFRRCALDATQQSS